MGMWSTLADGTSAHCTRFHYPVIDIPPDTICPRCDLIFNDTAEFQRPMEYPPPESIISDQCRNLCRCLWKRSLAKDPRQMESEKGRKGDENTSNSSVEGHELGAEGMCQGRQQEYGREATQRRPQDALRALSASEGSQRRSLHVEAPEYKKPKEQLRAYSELAATKGKGHGLGPPGLAAFTGLLQALSERGNTVGAANAAGVANLKHTWDDMEREEAFDLVPHCKLAKVYDPALSRLELVISVAQHREHIRGALGQTGASRLLGQAPSGALERALSAAIEQN